MKKLLFLFAAFFLASGIFYWRYTQSAPVIPQISQILPTKNIERSAIPEKFIIKSLGVNTNIESVGLTETGAMDVPKNADNVAWYNLGVRPGEQGSAVIAGHLDKITGAPAVFWNISKMQKGDEIVVIDSQKKSYKYIVEKTASYDYMTFPLQMVFATKDKKRLNLITCAGSWDTNKKIYSQRFVVFAIIKN